MNRSTLMTEYQDISQRLEYLVAHSSQMVFVTGEDMAIQNGFVEAFLGQQSQHANVAFLVAKKGKKKDYYRQQLADQLSFDAFNQRQTLVQNFSSRNDKDTPVLIAVTNAELMAKDMLRELWDLVLQNRFARTNEQINILVFGEQSWAEEVKAWLPTNNNDKPVLLTTQTLEYQEEHEVEGDLDEIIANRRKLFQERMEARSLNHYGHTSVLKAWWFRLVTAAFFVVCFSTILIWQYFDVTSTAAREFATFLMQTDVAESQQDDITVSSEPEDDIRPVKEIVNQDKAAESEINTNPRISAELDTSTLPKATSNENARVSDSFASALSSLDGSNPPILEGQNQDEIQGHSRPSLDQARQEYVADISTEQLKQLRDRSQQTNFQSDENIEIATPQESYSELTQSLNQEASDMLIEQQQTSSAATPENTFEQPLAQEPGIALDEAISTALEVMSRLQTSNQSESVETPPAVEQVPEAENAAPVVVDSLPQESGPIEVDNDLTEETVLTGGEVDDYQVEDILSEEQVLAQNTTIPETESPQSNDQIEVVNTQLQVPPQVEVVETPVANTAPGVPEQSVPESTAETVIPSYIYNESTLLAAPESDYVLQISGVSTADLLNDYLTDNNLGERVWVYHTQRYGGDWFVVLFNQSYSTLDEARRSAAQVTSLLPNAQPFVKSMEQVQQEISAGDQ